MDDASVGCFCEDALGRPLVEFVAELRCGQAGGFSAAAPNVLHGSLVGVPARCSGVQSIRENGCPGLWESRHFWLRIARAVQFSNLDTLLDWCLDWTARRAHCSWRWQYRRRRLGQLPRDPFPRRRAVPSFGHRRLGDLVEGIHLLRSFHGRAPGRRPGSGTAGSEQGRDVLRIGEPRVSKRTLSSTSFRS